MKFTDIGEITEDGLTGTIYSFIGGSKVTVLGLTNHKSNLYSRKYAVLCEVCAQDPELFGDGVFLSLKHSMIRGQSPCGCSICARKTKEQYSIICSRKAAQMGYEFLGFAEDFKGRSTKIILSCPDHGEWDTGIINNFTRRGVGCPGCKKVSVALRAKKEDEDIIKTFVDTGKFIQGTKFKRNSDVDNKGHLIFWDMFCPKCMMWFKATASSLQKGSISCLCSKQRQTSAYINILFDNELPAFLKLGISNFPEKRVIYQNRHSTFDIKNHSIFDFPTVVDCKLAERCCIETLETKVISDMHMPDGYTETTFIYNLDKIISIFKMHKGSLRSLNSELSHTLG